jgi:DNA primase
MIPIRDSQGRLVAFGGRTLETTRRNTSTAVKQNSSNKSALLFGFDRARQHVRRKRRVFIVEGYMDVLQLWAQGIHETVACMGTALTVRHLNLLKAATSTAYLFTRRGSGRPEGLTGSTRVKSSSS